MSAARIAPAARISPRLVFLAVFLGCAGLIVFGLWLQHARNLEPCPMCIVQRYAFIAAGVIALVGAVHGPKGWGSRVYGFLMAAAAVGGGSVAARQSWLQHNPPPATISCGPDLEFMLDSFPLTQALPMIFKGTGDCAKVQWTFAGLSIPEWALVCFVLIALSGLWATFRRA